MGEMMCRRGWPPTSSGLGPSGWCFLCNKRTLDVDMGQKLWSRPMIKSICIAWTSILRPFRICHIYIYVCIYIYVRFYTSTIPSNCCLPLPQGSSGLDRQVRWWGIGAGRRRQGHGQQAGQLSPKKRVDWLWNRDLNQGFKTGSYLDLILPNWLGIMN